MTDEEMAEEYADNISGLELTCSLLSAKDKNHAYRLGRYDGFLAGLKAGRPEWHKIADGDLPKEENHFWSRTVLLQTNKDSSIIGFYDHANKAWYEKETDDIVYGVIAWCEIPKYTEK